MKTQTLRGTKLKHLFEEAAKFIPIKMAVICPDSKESLEGMIQATNEKSITPILLGPLASIQKMAKTIDCDISHYQCLDMSPIEAIARAVTMARNGEIEAIIKGSMHTDELMSAIVKTENGLKTSRRMSHCMVLDIPSHDRLLILTDVALNVIPTLKEKKDIVQNAIDLAQALGIAKPKVALLSAIETISEHLPNTIDCAALCKMADRGQIKGGVLDGPLAFDLAISMQAKVTKKLQSEVAGQPDILVVPNLEVGNILVKALDHFANSLSLGIILGAKIPVIVTSRSADAASRAGSCMLTKFYVHHVKT